MSVLTLLTHPVLLKYRVSTGKDHYGHPVFDESEAITTCYARLLSTDDADSISREQIDYRVYLPASTPTEGLHAMELGGERFDVQGPSHAQFNPRVGRDEYIVVSVRRAAS